MMQKIETLQWIYGLIAVFGGVARYLNNYTNDGKPFSLSILIASTFVSGFSGWMFAVLGLSMDMPQSIVFIMAGTGGFFGEQTMKLIYEYVTARAKVAE